MAKIHTKGTEFNLKKMTVPLVVMLAFFTLGSVLWRSSGQIMALFFFGYIGTSVGVGLGLYAALPKKKKPLGRRLSLILVGTFLVGLCCDLRPAKTCRSRVLSLVCWEASSKLLLSII